MGIKTSEASQYRLVLSEPTNLKPFGTLITERELLLALEPYGTVWSLSLKPEIAYVTFRQPEAVARLVGDSILVVNGTNLTVKNYLWHANTQVCHHHRRCCLRESISPHAMPGRKNARARARVPAPINFPARAHTPRSSPPLF